MKGEAKLDGFQKFLIGLRINKLRKSKNLSMDAFAKQIGVAGKSTVNEWEKGRAIPSEQALEKIAKLGSVSKEYILYGSLQEYVKSVLHRHIEDETLFVALKKYLYTTTDLSSFENAPLVYDNKGKPIPRDEIDEVVYGATIDEMTKAIDSLLPKIMVKINEEEITYYDEPEIIVQALSVINNEIFIQSFSFEGMYYLCKKALNELPFGSDGDFSSEKAVASLKKEGYSDKKILEFQYEAKFNELKSSFLEELNELYEKFLEDKDR